MDWRNRAACLDVDDPELFFPVGNTGPALVQIERAKTVCNSAAFVRPACSGRWSTTKTLACGAACRKTSAGPSSAAPLALAAQQNNTLHNSRAKATLPSTRAQRFSPTCAVSSTTEPVRSLSR